MRSHPNLTIHDIAEKAGVSTATVSRILNGNARVSADKVARVRAIIEELGYKANPFAKSLLTGHLKTVGVLVPNLKDEFYGVIVNAIEHRLSEHGLHMMCSLGHDDPEKELDAIKTFQSRNLDAYILFADLISDDDLLELMQQNVPFVLLNRFLPEAPDRCVYIDNTLGGFLATQHLIELGHTRIAHITGPLNRPDTLGRYTGYVKALEAAGIPVDSSLVLSANGSEWGEIEGEKLTQRLLSRSKFTAIFAATDWLAVGAMSSLEAAGLGVPADVSLVSFDNRSFTPFTHPKMTTIHYPREEMGVLAADRLVSLLQEKPLERLDALQPQLIVRGSTRKASS